MIAPAAPVPLVADIELQLLLEAVYRVSGYDFREYTPAFVKRRVSERMRAEGVATISALQDRILHDPEALDRFVFALSAHSSKLFDDPKFYGELRTRVLPMLRTFPMVRAWVVGCGRGEDVFSLAILFREAGISSRSRIYATDISKMAIAAAKQGRLNGEPPDELVRRYRESGGEASLATYVSFETEPPSVRTSTLGNIVFCSHNLVSDRSFNEFQLIVCRDVLSQFNKTLAIRAHQVFFDSLSRGGYLALGSSDSIGFSPHQRCFERISDGEQIHRRIR